MDKKQKSQRVPGYLRTTFSILERFSVGLASRLAIKLFFSPIRYPVPEREQELAKQAKRSALQYKDADLAVYSWGQGPKVLLVHGWSGRGTQLAKLGQELAAKGYEAISFDAPAHGRSRQKQTHLMEFVAVISKLEKEFGPFEAAVGHSLGGMALMNALQEGLQLKQLVTIGAPATTPGVIRDFCDLINVSERVGKRIQAHLESRFQRAVSTFSAASIAASVQVEGLVIHDEDDHDASVENAHRIHKAWRGSKLFITKGLGHRKILFDPEVLATVVEFMKQ